MIIRKSPEELEKMRRAGRIVAGTIDAVLEAVEPGRTTHDLDVVAERYIDEQGAVSSFKGYKGTYPAVICASIDAEIVHGIPSAKRKLVEGQVLSLDFGASWEGYHADSAVTVFVGGQSPSDEASRLVKTTEEALYAGIAAAQPGARLSDIGHAVESVASPTGLGIIREYGGHGIGRAMHEDPFISNFGRPGRGPDLRPGLVIAIEPMLVVGGEDNRVLDDGWTVVTADGSLAAHFEHTVAVTEDGPEIFTKRD
ncbi:MAG TPA: type I methionyl aminopeptidase [Actinomycetota bacterium]|nr:type I methionyl aminopeptidase [Actinomycetota bacterium]